MNDERVSLSNPSASALQAQIDLKASPERVFAAWTRAEELPRWFGPRKGGHLQVDRFEPSVGGDYDVTMVFADGDRAQITGRYLELDPPRRIVLTWAWHDEGGLPSEETLVTVDLLPTEDGTRLTLLHERFAAVADRDNHAQGWATGLVRLDAYLNA